MNISIGPRWEKFVEDAVREGRYGSASDVVQEGLRLVAAREAKLKALQEAVREGIESGFTVDDAELDRTIAELDEELAREGY
jgi:antitoxin ParD1/3/4